MAKSKILSWFTSRGAAKAKQQLTEQVPLVSVVDRFSSYPSKGLTPERLAAILREADDGTVYRQAELFEEMLEKDGHLQALFQARRLAVTRRNYSIVAASDDPKAQEIANAVDKMIKRIRHWNNSVGDILDCVPKGFSVCELGWALRGEQIEIDRLRWLHQKKFRFGRTSDPLADPEELRLLVDPAQVHAFRGIVADDEVSRASTEGISLEMNPGLRQRFIVTICRARSGNPSRASLMRTCTYLYLFKNYDVKWWIQFAEGMLGYRIGKYDPSQPEQKDVLLQALQGLATDAAAVMSKDSLIEFVELAGKASSHQVYGDLKDWCNGEMSEVVLGHTAAATSTPGKLGNEDLAKLVRQEIVEADAQVLDEGICDNIIHTYVDLNWGPQEEYPAYKTDVSVGMDLSAEADVDGKLQLMGFPISRKYIMEKYGRPLPTPDDPEDEVLVPQQQSPFPVPASGGRFVSASKKKLLTDR